MTLVTLAIPGVVLAAGYIFAWNQPWMNTVLGGTPYGTLGLLLAAYVAGALPFSARLASGALAQVGDHLLEAARLAGAGTGELFAASCAAGRDGPAVDLDARLHRHDL